MIKLYVFQGLTCQGFTLHHYDHGYPLHHDHDYEEEHDDSGDGVNNDDNGEIA